MCYYSGNHEFCKDSFFDIYGWFFLLAFSANVGNQTNQGTDGIRFLRRFNGKYELFAAFLPQAAPLCYNSDDFNEV